MSKQRYRAVHPGYFDLNGEDGTFETVFASAADEADWLDRGLLELVARRYKVVGPRRVRDTAPGDTFEAALRMDEEAALISAGHIARVGGPLPEPEPTARRRRTTPKE